LAQNNRSISHGEGRASVLLHEEHRYTAISGNPEHR